MSKFEENRTEIATVRVPQRKNTKWPPWRHQIRNFKNREKWHWQISVRSFVESFIKIGSSVWAWAVEVTQTHAHTHTFKMTEYKKKGVDQAIELSPKKIEEKILGTRGTGRSSAPKKRHRAIVCLFVCIWFIVSFITNDIGLRKMFNLYKLQSNLQTS